MNTCSYGDKFLAAVGVERNICSCCVGRVKCLYLFMWREISVLTVATRERIINSCYYQININSCRCGEKYYRRWCGEKY